MNFSTSSLGLECRGRCGHIEKGRREGERKYVNCPRTLADAALCHARSRHSCCAEWADLLPEGDYAERAVAVTIGTGGKEELVVFTVGADILTELNGPDVVDLDGIIAGIAERA